MTSRMTTAAADHRKTVQLSDTGNLIACPHCDALYTVRIPQKGERAVCTRCHLILIAPRRNAGLQIIVLALTVAILLIAASVFPFLRIEAAGVANATSIVQVALTFTGGKLFIVSIVMVALVVVIPLVRVTLLIYVLFPLVMDRRPSPGSKRAFRFAEHLRPWSMVEVFALGCAVALIKVSDLAHIDFGPAFWMFAVLVVLAVMQDTFTCGWSVWNALETKT
jgi:paraquat-inducible protein A